MTPMNLLAGLFILTFYAIGLTCAYLAIASDTTEKTKRWGKTMILIGKGFIIGHVIAAVLALAGVFVVLVGTELQRLLIGG